MTGPSSRTRARRLSLAVLAALLVPGASGGRAGADEPDPAPRRFTRVPAPDGIEIRRYNKTDGAQPGPKDRVLVHYRGSLVDGTVFDSSGERRRPASFRLDKVIPCWTKGLVRLRVGESARLTCPAAVAYGSAGSPPSIPGNARLIFEVELVGIE